MSSPATLLIYGNDLQLLETRRLVLASSGDHVVAAADVYEFDGISATVSVDLLVLCHTLSAKEYAHACAVARGYWAQMRTLSLTSGDLGFHPSLAGDIVDASLGPAHLVNTVAKLLAAQQAN